VADIFDRPQRLAGGTIRRKSAQIEDRVRDQLSGPVKCNVATAIAFEDLNATLGKQFGRGQNVSSLRVATQRDDCGMLEKQNDIADAAVFAKRDQLFLQAETRGVINGAELENGNHLVIE
jgi:hypothetical protein